MEIKISKGSVTCISFDGVPAPGTGKLHWMLTREILRYLAA
jgi:hypothetical protein